MQNNKLIIFDTTLRDGEQSPGFAMRSSEKIEIMHALESIKVPVIEVGFPVISSGEFRAVSEVASASEFSTLCVLARCNSQDIKIAATSLSEVIKKGRGRIHIFLPSSDLHIKEKLGLTRKKAIKLLQSAISAAQDSCDNIQVGFEDASRANSEFLVELTEIAAGFGVNTITFADTVGIAQPAEIYKMILTIKSHVPEDIIIGIHCHNDLGNAVANSLAALGAGAKQIECTVHGIGERSGNASLEQVVANIHLRQSFFDVNTSVDLSKLTVPAQKLSLIFNFSIPANHPITGSNAFRHGSGIHQNGIVKNINSYGFFDPEIIGEGHKFVFTKHSGIAGFKEILRNQEIVLQETLLEKAFADAKSLADTLVEDRIRIVPNDRLIEIAKSYNENYL